MNKINARLLQLLIVVSIFTSSMVFLTVFRLGEKFGKSLAVWFQVIYYFKILSFGIWWFVRIFKYEPIVPWDFSSNASRLISILFQKPVEKLALR